MEKQDKEMLVDKVLCSFGRGGGGEGDGAGQQLPLLSTMEKFG